MSRQAGGVILVLGLVAVVVLTYRLVNKQAKTRIEAKQKAAFEEAQIAREVVCDDCGAVSPMTVVYIKRRKFQQCPACGANAARPIVYFICENPGCNRQLVKFTNHVMEGSIFHKSPEGRPVCPVCGRPDQIRPEELFLADAKKTAEETGQDLP